MIAANAAGISFTDGIWLRVAMLVAGWLICVAYVMRYAKMVRSDPSKSLVADKWEENRAHFLGNKSDQMLEFTTTRKIVLGIFVAAFAVMIYGVAVLGWWMAQISGVFLAAAIIVGVISRMSEEELTSNFIDGARDLLGVALIIGIARGIVVVMDNGMITHTILHSAGDSDRPLHHRLHQRDVRAGSGALLPGALFLRSGGADHADHGAARRLRQRGPRAGGHRLPVRLRPGEPGDPDLRRGHGGWPSPRCPMCAG